MDVAGKLAGCTKEIVATDSNPAKSNASFCEATFSIAVTDTAHASSASPAAMLRLHMNDLLKNGTKLGIRSRLKAWISLAN